ncbi:hypothetical protein BJV78DRAFT_1373598 [Lactifluus subvellereus]|nr:hypothetical protein BJV78DRAFT_1373598 [Lactifluus subvellereus]
MSNLLPNPQTGSANPSASLPALWSYIQPALDHIIRSQTNNPSKAPAVDVGYHMGIHTALYNYFTNHVSESSTPPSHPAGTTSAPTHTVMPRSSSTAIPPPGYDVYDQLDAYFADVARDVLLGAPQDDSTLVHYLVPCFTRYSTGAQSINRLLNYVNRQHVRRAIDEDKGWLRVSDIISEVVAEASSTGPGSHRKITEKLRERRAAELRRWGAPDGGTAEQLAQAEACAEAASAPGRVVPVLSLAYRCFRTEVLEPLLVVPKPKGEGKKKKKDKGRDAAAVVPGAEADKAAAVGPRGRLARAVKELLESKGADEEEQNRLASEMADMLMRTGVRGDHPLRRRLRKHCALIT